MSRTPAFILCALALGACTQEAPPAPAARGPVTPEVPAPPAASASAPPAASASVTPAAPAASATPASPPFVVRELPPTVGDVLPALRDEAERARARGLVPVVLFHAGWCPPCRVFDENLRAPEIAAALEGVHLVRLDMDDWHDKIKGSGYAPRFIPAFYLIGEDGRPTGKMLDGDRWKKASAAQIGEALTAFLAPAKRAR